MPLLTKEQVSTRNAIIIETYVQNPDLTLKDIGNICGCSTQKASSAISMYFKNKRIIKRIKD